MKKILYLLMLIFPVLGYSQDLIILKNGEELHCKITNVEGGVINYYTIEDARRKSGAFAIRNIQSYKIGEGEPITSEAFKEAEQKTVFEFVPETEPYSEYRVNLLTYSRSIGLGLKSWGIQYHGFKVKSSSRWSVPFYFHFETIVPERFRLTSIGTGGMFRVDDNFFINLGGHALLNMTSTEGRILAGVGSEVAFILVPKSPFGITGGLSIYDKLFFVKGLPTDLGVKLNVGLKF